uniref:Uncharacterized protein n=1 Tax=Nonomuraea gerenzanensis TaxID=93944 RepID=A0A1M4E9E4_9ACTN|nr:hypothetical protein BN4615_P5047 [Nonomuraea gerenzanensis]
MLLPAPRGLRGLITRPGDTRGARGSPGLSWNVFWQFRVRPPVEAGAPASPSVSSEQT